MMISNPFETLALHLLALTQAIQSPSDQPQPKLPLTPTPFGGICYQNSIMGRFWNTCNHAWSLISPQAPEASLEKTIHHALTELFNQAISKAYDARQFRMHDHLWQLNRVLEKNPTAINKPKQRDTYEKILIKELNRSIESPLAYLKDFDQKTKELNEAEKTASRHLITYFFWSTDFFWPFVMKDRPGQSSFRAAILPFLQGTDKVCLLDRPLFKALKKENSWVRVEEFTEQPIPIACLAKIKDLTLLTVKEKETLKNWVKALNSCQLKITPRQLFHVLTDVVNLFDIQGSSKVTLSDLLLWLDKEKCPLLYEEDDSHMNWREKLKPGSKITSNGKELILGKLLSPQKADGQKDRYKVFALQDHPDKVIKIACNRFLLLLERIKAKDPASHWGIRFVEAKEDFDLDQEGRYVVQEYLQPLFEVGTWQSHAFELKKEEEHFALVFVNHLAFLLQTGTSICDFSLSHLMWDVEGKLKSTRLLVQQRADYREWEKFCLQVARGNEFVLRFLVQVSNLHEEKMALYYRDVVQNTLQTGEIRLIGKPLPLEHRDQEKEGVESVCEEAKKLRQECLNMIIARLRTEGQYSHVAKEDIEEKLVKALLAVYSSSATPASFSLSFKQQVIAHYFSTHPPLLQPSPSYYQNRRDFLRQAASTDLLHN